MTIDLSFLNSFTLQNGKGWVDSQNGSLNALEMFFDINSAETDPLSPGQAVIFSDVENSLPVIDAMTDNTVRAAGIVTTANLKNEYSPGESLKIAMNGTIVWLEASGAIKCGDELEYVVSGKKVATKNLGKRLGMALRKASNGNFLPVLIDIEY